MYGDVGLPTTKGSGTNGYIQRSLAYINRKEYQPGGYKAIIEKFREQPAPTKRKINNEETNYCACYGRHSGWIAGGYCNMDAYKRLCR